MVEESGSCHSQLETTCVRSTSESQRAGPHNTRTHHDFWGWEGQTGGGAETSFLDKLFLAPAEENDVREMDSRDPLLMAPNPNVLPPSPSSPPDWVSWVQAREPDGY